MSRSSCYTYAPEQRGNTRSLPFHERRELARNLSLARFVFQEGLLKGQGRSVEVVNVAENGTEDLLADLVSIISSFCARLYGQRRARRKTEKIVAELEKGDDDATSGEAHDQQN